jgi:hypothetical protein
MLIFMLFTLGAATVALTWRRRGGGLLPLALIALAISPIALTAWLGAQFSRWRLSRPAQVRRSLSRLGLQSLTQGRSISARRISQGYSNSVVKVTLEGGQGLERQVLVIKHVLRFGTLLAWVAREFSATNQHPQAISRRARTIREIKALRCLHRHGIPAPLCLAYRVRDGLFAMEWIEGVELGALLHTDVTLAARLGALMSQMHSNGFAMGDANPTNLLVNRAGQIVALDHEFAHLGRDAVWAKKGFDLAWAASFMPNDSWRRVFFEHYGELSQPLLTALTKSEAHLLRFGPAIDWFAQYWRRGAPLTAPAGIDDPSTASRGPIPDAR